MARPFQIEEHCYVPPSYTEEEVATNPFDYKDVCAYEGCGRPEVEHLWTVEAYKNAPALDIANRPEQEALPLCRAWTLEEEREAANWVLGADRLDIQSVYLELKSREEQLAEALSSLAKAEERNHELEKECDTARMACSLACELHGCASELCIYAEYHKHAQKMFSDLEAAEERNHELENALRDAPELHEWKWAVDEAREAILNERYGLAEFGLGSDQINAVLDIIDEYAYPDLPSPPSTLEQEGR